MAGVDIPAVGEISDANVSKTDQKNNLEALSETLRRTMGTGLSGSPAAATDILGGAISPSRGVVYVDTEGAVAQDVLDTIDVANYRDGSMLFLGLFSDGSREVGVVNTSGGVGGIQTKYDDNFILDSDRKFMLLVLRGTTWIEMIRGFGPDVVAERGSLNLGTSALLDNGALDAATLAGLAPAAFLPAGASAVDSLALGGVSAAGFARKDTGLEQLFAGPIRSDGSQVEVNEPNVNQASVRGLLIDGVKRARFAFDDSTDEMRIESFESDGVTLSNGFRLRDGIYPEAWDKASTTWLSLFDPVSNNIVLPELRLFYPTATQHGPVTAVVLLSGNLPQVPSQAPEREYEVSFRAQGVSQNPSGPGAGGMTYRIHVGPTGDATDPVVLSDSVATAGPTDLAISEKVVMIRSTSDTDKITLMASNGHPTNLMTISGASEPNPNLRDEPVYLRVRQVI